MVVVPRETHTLPYQKNPTVPQPCWGHIFNIANGWFLLHDSWGSVCDVIWASVHNSVTLQCVRKINLKADTESKHLCAACSAYGYSRDQSGLWNAVSPKSMNSTKRYLFIIWAQAWPHCTGGTKTCLIMITTRQWLGKRIVHPTQGVMMGDISCAAGPKAWVLLNHNLMLLETIFHT